VLKKIIILIFLGSWAITFAQEPIRFTTKQGLPTNHVYDIAEDDNGFMWFATKQGLVKYDGETFKTFTIKDGLPNNDTWLLETDLQGRLWFFSKSQYQGYIKNDSIYTFTTIDKVVTTPRFTYKTKDSLWFFDVFGLRTINNTHIINTGLFSKKTEVAFNKKSLAIQREHDFNDNRQMPYFINPATQEYIYLQKTKLLIYDWNLEFKQEIPIDIPLVYENSKIVNNGLLYNQIGFYAFEKGVLFIDFKTYKTVYKSFKDMVGMENINYFRCFGLKDEIQISIPGHLMIFDYHLNLKNTYTFPEHLSAKSYKDSKDNLWLVDLANGITLIPNTQEQTNYFLNNKKVQKVNSINQTIYAGINDDGFYFLDTIQKKFNLIEKFRKQNAEIYQIKKIKALNKSYFISAGGFFEYENKTLKPFKIKLDVYESGFIGGSKDITIFNKNYYIISSNAIYKTSNPKKNAQIVVEKSGLLFTEVFNNQLFVAGSDGLHIVEGNKLIKPVNNNSLLNISITNLAVSKDFLIVGTDGRGVYLYANSEIIHLKETDGLSIQRIIQKENNLWIATQKGVKKLRLNLSGLESSKIIDAFYEADGLLQNNTNDIYLEDNLLYAASDIGLAQLNLNSNFYKQKPSIYFKTKKDTLIFKNGERNNISVSFAALDFVNQEHLTFEYRLLPKQKIWIPTTTKTLNFSNLSPNLHTLEIKATDQHNNITIKQLRLNIIPAWYQTIIAKLAFLIFSLLLFGILIKLIQLQIRKKEEAKAQQENRIAGLELQALRSQMNPHFVHNSLNAIQYFIQRNEVELSENYLVKFSKLIRLFFEYSRKQYISIKNEVELLDNYLQIEKLRFEDKLDYKIIVDPKIDIEEQTMPSMILQPIVENAVNHGLFHKQSNGLVTITFKFIDIFSFKVCIEDDGIGIKKAKEIYKNSSKNYQSSSSAVLNERLELLNLSKNWEIIYTITDLQSNKTSGTLVELTFKQPEK